MPTEQPPKQEVLLMRRPIGSTRRGAAMWWVIGLLLFVALAFGASKLAPSRSAKNTAEVMVDEVKLGDLVVSVTEQGKLESSQNAEIKCRVKGGSTVLWVVDSGTVVKKGDELVRLDKASIEDNISTQKIAYETAVANKATAESDVAVAKIGIEEYLEGTFRSLQTTAQKDVVIAESNLKSARNALGHAEKMFRKGYNSKLDLEAQVDAVEHARLELDVKKTDLDSLEKYTRAKEMETLNNVLKIAVARLAAEEASLDLERARLDRAENQLENCQILSDRDGIVLHPNAAEWKETPDIEEGASVREDQVLLIMPDLSQMQVKVGIHESKVDRLQVGMPCRVQLQDGYVEGEVAQIATISKGGGWWNGNLVNYDTIVKVEDDSKLKPGMTVAVEIFLAKYKDVITVPVATVLEIDQKFYCWIDKGGSSPEKREVVVMDSNDTFAAIKEGLKPDERVVLNPRDFVAEASVMALKSIRPTTAPAEVPDFDASKAKGSKEKEGRAKESKDKPGDKTKAKTPRPTGASILKMADKNKDGVLTKDELDEKGKQDMKKNDSNGDGKLDEKELDAAIKQAIGGTKKK